MNEETNNEMDLLLRRLGRRPDKSVADANGDIDHLDADELSAYAENVLPAAARARYTAHLAECARCRELVVQLSASAGVVPVIETIKAPEASALRKFLASLFSPLVMRYAVPALGLIIVAAIGLFVLRQNKRDAGSIAQNAEAPKYTITATPDASAPQESTKEFTAQLQKEAPAINQARSSASPGNQTAAAAPAPEAPPVAKTSGDTNADEAAKKDQPQAVTTDAVTAAAPKPASTPDVREQQARTESREEAPRVQAANEPPAEKSADMAKVKQENRKEAEGNAARSTPTSIQPGFSGLTAAAPGTSARAKATKDNEAEDKNRDDSKTTTVAGRHFRKQGDVWVDTAYNFSRTAISVTRGSEQYRALVADEPQIKTIADQLDGEILVVWKGRSYRIR